MSSSPILDRLAWLPAWASTDDVRTCVEQIMELPDMEPKRTLANRILGPAVAEAFKANAVVWVTAAVLPCLGVSFMNCPEENDAFVTCPWQLWLLYPLIFGAAFSFEMRAMMYALPVQTIMTGRFQIMGITLPFAAWAVTALALSLVAHMDLFTSGLVTAKVIKTDWCYGDSGLVNQIWRNTLTHSTVPFLAGLHYSVLVVSAWIMMFSQIIYALLCSVPWGKNYNSWDLKKGEDVDYELRFPRRRGTQDFAYPWYNSLLFDGMGHEDAFAALGEAARMEGALLQEPSAQMAKVRALAGTSDACQLPDLYKDMRRAFMKFIVFFLLEKAIQPNLQVSFLGLVIAATGKVDPEVVISVILSLITGLRGVIIEVMKMRQLYRAAGNAPMEHYTVTAEKMQVMKDQWLDRTLLQFLALACIGIALLGLAAVKLYEVTCVCDSGLWNLNGCAPKFIPGITSEAN